MNLVYYAIRKDKRIIEITTKILYFKFTPHNKRFLVSDATVGDCIKTDSGKLYGLLGHNLPENFPYSRVDFIVIDEVKFNTLNEQLTNNIEIIDEDSLTKLKNNKIAELKGECNKLITSGITVRLSDKKLHTFELTIEDQLNLKTIENNLYSMGDVILFHEKGHVCRLFSKQDMKHIIKQVNRHIYYHTTYFNLLKYCILNMNSTSEIETAYYGMIIPDNDYRKLLKYVSKE